DAPVDAPFEAHLQSLPSSGSGWEQALSRAARSWNVVGDASVTVRVAAPATSSGDQAGGDARNTVDGGAGTGDGVITAFFAVDEGDLLECDLRVHTTNDQGAVAWSTATTPS